MSLQATIAKLLLKLPKSMLVSMSGGRPVEIGGRTLDPHFQFLSHGARKQPPMSSLDPATARAASAQGLAMFAPPRDASVSVKDFTIPSDDHTLPVRLYQPERQDGNIPMMVYFHFGGGVIGDLDTSDAFCALIASMTRGPVLSVDYRLAPEHKWPAGLNDATNAYLWALRNAESYGAPPGVAAVGGDSMGGNFAAIVAQEMKREDKPQPALQLLIYPAVDVQSDTPSMRVYGDTYPLSTDTMNWFMEQYIPEGADLSDPRLSPLQETDLSGLCPAIVITAGFDPLVDQGKVYRDRLADAGVDVDFRCFDSLAHGFTAFMGVSPAARIACEDIAMRVAEAYRDADI